MRFLGMLVALAATAAAGNDPNAWVFYESAETARGPRLVVTLESGKTHDVAPSADVLLISYLADGHFHRHRQLSVSLSDTNRILLRFEPPAGKIKQAVLVWQQGVPQKLAPTAPFPVALHKVTAKWTEDRTTWRAQPAFDAKPFARADVQPRAGEMRIDVTAAVRAGLPHGFLVRSAVSLDKAPAPTMPRARPQPARPVDSVLKFAPSIPEAKAQAAKSKRLVLALVRGEFRDGPFNFQEETLLATALTHPDVRAVIERNFVLTRVHYVPYLYTFGQPDGRDPLPALGTTCVKAKAPALVVAKPDGTHVATFGNIGTYDHGVVHRFLRRAAGDKAPVRKPTAAVAAMRRGAFEEAEKLFRAADDDEARYYLACLRFRAGARAEAEALWKRIDEDSLWHPKAKARLQWPDRMAMYECLRAPGLPVTATTTEVPRERADAIERGCRWLLEHQRPDGSWAIARKYLDTDAAATALAARALLLHGKDPGKAVDWLRSYLATTKPAQANCWSAHYTLDFFLAAMKKDERFKADAQKAADFVAGGQCPNGAWSYSNAWGVGWRGGIGAWPKTDKGRYHSMNTGPSLVALLRAKAAGLTVKPEVFTKGKEALLRMRQRPGVWTYTWPVPLTFEKAPRASIGRAPACELALLGLGGATKKHLELTMKTFLEFRGGLRRPAKLHASWLPPSLTSSYFYSFAYLHAAESFAVLKDEKARELLRKDILQVMEADGSWVDHEESGKPYATAMALIVLR